MTLRKIVRLLPVSLLAALPFSQAHATWSAPAQVTYVNATSTGFFFSLSGIGTGCPDGTSQFYVDWSTNGAKQIYAMTLTSMHMGSRVAANFTCDTTPGNGHAYTVGTDTRN